MKQILNKVLKSSFVKNVAIMMTGTVGAQAVTMAFSPVITRLYGPDAFGLMGTFTALTRIIIPVSALTYPIAIVLPKNDKNAKELIKLSLLIAFITAVLTTIILLLFNTSIINIFRIEDIAPYLYLIPIVIIFSGFMQVSEQWLIRTNQFSINAKANFMQSVITNVSKAGIGFVYPTATMLVFLQAAGNGIKAFLMIFFVRNSNYKEQINSQEKQLSMKKIAKNYIDFPLYRAPEGLLSSISQNLPVLLLASLFGPAAAGFYNIGRTVLGLPSKIIGQSIGDVFYPRISEATNNGENIHRLIKKATLSLVAIGAIPFGLVFFWGPSLFEFVFGLGWEVAGEYARWIALSSFSIFINKPSIKSMPVLKAQRFHLVFTCIMLITRIVALMLGFFVFNSDLAAVALFGISGALLNCILILVTLKMSKKISPVNRYI